MRYVNRLRDGSGLFRKKKKYRIFAAVFAIVAVIYVGPSLAIDISDRPLDVEFHAASTTVMFVLDDSGSMDWEFMTSESNGLFNNNYYIYPNDPGDNSYSYRSYSSKYMGATERATWKSQWFGYNRLYYNPGSVYTPWPSNTGPGNFPGADTVSPRSNPMNASATLTLQDTYLSVQRRDSEGGPYVRNMDQRGPNDSTSETNCGKWVVVGEYELNHTEAWQVTIERTETGISGNSTVSGAVKFKNVSDSSEVIIDDEDGEPEYKEFGNWYNSSRSPNYSNITRYAEDAGDRAVYTPTLTSSGLYEISVWWNCYSRRDREAKVTVAKEGQQVQPGSQIEIKNSHYYLLDDINSSGTVDSGEGVYLVNIDGGSRSYYRVQGDGDGVVEDLELVEIQRADIPVSIRPGSDDGAELQNFANWYSFYRRRSLTAKAAVARTIVGIEGLKVGFYSINKRLKQEARSVKITLENGTVEDDTPALLTGLYGLRSLSGTPLREGLVAVGDYYKGTTAGTSDSYIGLSPYQAAEDGGECQRVYAIAMTDGYWTQTSFTLGDQAEDKDQDGDGVENTLADVAMKYYKNDLRPDLNDNVPPSVCKSISLFQSHQHMVTFSVSFGVFGSLNPDDYDICTLKNTSDELPPWPTPFCGDCSAKIDDLWHAAANTRGEFFSASDPESLVRSLTDIFIEIEAREISGASVAVSAEKLYTESRMFEGSYLSTNWTGDIKAYDLTYDNESNNITIDQVPAWSAAEKLNSASVTWESRKIITYDGSTGKPFQWSDLSAVQKSYLNNNEYMLKYLRGFRLSDAADTATADKAGLQPFRVRDSRLGDIVNSSPVKIGESLYVGANDGMLHVFNATDGAERFSYVPNLVFQNLEMLTDSEYQHKFYVDQTPVYSYIRVGDSMKTYLVGGLNKGGKGYYCLDVTDVDTMVMTETNLAALVKWEFSDIPDLGYTFSKPVIVQTESADHEYIVVFGNGYNSTNGNAVLFIVDLLTGIEITRIETKAGGDNGLSTPIATDVNSDWKVDYVYAGDLKGNLWKFDLSSENYSEWAVAFGDTLNPAPLFKTAAGQPITSRPDVMRHCVGEGSLVAFGTGRYLGVSDLANTSIQAVYGIWDYGDDDDNGEFLGDFNKTDLTVSKHPDEVRLLEQEVLTAAESGDSILRTTTEREADWRVVDDQDDANGNQTQVEGQMPNPIKNIGWFLDLQTPKERVYQNVIIRSGVLTVLSMVPVADACSGGGYSMIHTLDPCSGSQVVEAWTYQNNKLEEPTIIETPDGEKMLFSHKIPPPPLEGTRLTMGRYFWREIQ